LQEVSQKGSLPSLGLLRRAPTTNILVLYIIEESLSEFEQWCSYDHPGRRWKEWKKKKYYG
jgi:hypothetical protein